MCLHCSTILRNPGSPWGPTQLEWAVRMEQCPGLLSEAFLKLVQHPQHSGSELSEQLGSRTIRGLSPNSLQSIEPGWLDYPIWREWNCLGDSFIHSPSLCPPCPCHSFLLPRMGFVLSAYTAAKRLGPISHRLFKFLQCSWFCFVLCLFFPPFFFCFLFVGFLATRSGKTGEYFRRIMWWMRKGPSCKAACSLCCGSLVLGKKGNDQMLSL